MASSVTAHGNRWRVRWRLYDGKMQSFSHADKNVAARFKLWLESVVEEGMFADTDPRIAQGAYLRDGGRIEPEGPTLRKIMVAWVKERELDGATKATIDGYRARIERWAPIYDLPYEAVSEQMIKERLRDLRTLPQPTKAVPYAANTLHETVGFLTAAVGRAHQRGDVNVNVCAAIKLPEGAGKAEHKFLSRSQYAEFIEFAPNDQTRDVCDFMVGTGCRIGEVLGLRKDDPTYDGEYPTVLVDETYTNGMYGPTKNKETRIVDLAEDVWEMLQPYMLGGHQKDPIFPHPLKGGPWTYNSFCVQWDKMVRDAMSSGMRFRHGVPTTHWLRHTHAAWMLETRECSLYELSERLGHGSIQITVDMYGHISPEARERTMRAVRSIGLGGRGHASS